MVFSKTTLYKNNGENAAVKRSNDLSNQKCLKKLVFLITYITFLQVEFFGDAVTGWENTLHCLHNQKKGSNRDADEHNLISEMDPDAPFRQQSKRLHPLDKEDEMRLLVSVFSRLRCGQLDEAQQLCFRAGQPYRAAVLEGWKLFHDPNMKLSSDSGTSKSNIDTVN